ncbi:MAG: bifunctional salicylyl-CoA 5-hydroxylase/oxidoreductase [Planctomycetota bacterium]|nr:bifunctional salicylyl-CoA 5-hydroxylase/oxidoreductase [Planctomycetota bacterium]
MNIASIGGGPAGLYFAILMKKAFPDAKIEVFERNRSDDTFGWGVVFSDETLSNFEEADPESFAEIRQQFRYWGDIETWYGDTCVRSTGHGFCGMSRKKLLQIFHDRCRALGVELVFDRDVKDDTQVGPRDLILAADGLNSLVRTKYERHFEPSIDWRKAKFTWLGTTKPLEAFTFIFRETRFGIFQVHAYPFEANLSTFIVECHETTWKNAGLDRASEAETVKFCEELFADHLDGHRLISNRSIWRTFPTVRNEKWSYANIVLLGDAAHTAHFSIGSGTKLAMEDSIALVEAFELHGTSDVPRVLAAYEDSRKVDVIKTQKAAQTSLEWFEHSSRFMRQDPLQFSFNLMTRSKRITYDNLAKRDPELVKRVTDWFGETHGIQRDARGVTAPPMFAPFTLRSMKLMNRIVVSPMCQYSAQDGVPNEWHFTHLTSRAIGGAGLVFAEATNVSAEGRITLGCTGIWNDVQAAAWKRIVDFVHAKTAAKIGLQIGHAGRKASCSLPWEGDDALVNERAWKTLGPSADPFYPHWPAPRAMDRLDMDRVRDEFVRSIKLAERAGFDIVELHMAHGYLLSSFLSPKSNLRTDDYGGSLANRMRYPLEVFAAARATWPAEKPMAVRISASDWLDDAGGWTIEDSIQFARELKARGCDIVDVSSAGNTPESKPEYGRMYQLPFAERIRAEADVPVIAVGGIQGADHANTILAAGRADLCALARPHLADPYLTSNAAIRYGVVDVAWPKPYLAVKPRPRSDREE